MGSKCILTLAHSLFNKGYCFNMDNFFSSPDLFDMLCQNQSDAVGTVRINRQSLSDELKTIALQKEKSLLCIATNSWLFDGETRSMSACTAVVFMIMQYPRSLCVEKSSKSLKFVMIIMTKWAGLIEAMLTWHPIQVHENG